MADQEKFNKSVFDLFASSQETYEEAKKKNSEESNKKVNYLRMSKDGTYSIRILPLAPVIDSEGNCLPMDRKGYEYPLQSLMLKIEDPNGNDKKDGKDSKSKAKTTFVTVCRAKYAFPDLKSDLIDTYLETACSLYADDEKLCEKLRSGSFNGGLKWDSKRCMYVFDCQHREDGLQVLQLSFPQYKEIEDRKLNLWAKLLKKNPTAPCPVCSIDNAYPVEIVRKTGSKTEYNFNIDTVSGTDELTEEEMQALLDAPRLPEVLYRYTRYHLEATIAYLTQLDKKYDINVMKSDEIAECIEQIKLVLPANDQTHFTIANGSESTEEDADDLDSLWERYDNLENEELDDKSAEGQELRTSIKEFIENNKLKVKVTRSKTNLDLLEEIEKLISNSDDDNEEEPEPQPEKREHTRHKLEEPEPEPEPEDEPEEEPEADPDPEPEPEDDDDEPEEAPVRSRVRERNDDTNEPAARTSRRSARPARRR